MDVFTLFLISTGIPIFVLIVVMISLFKAYNTELAAVESELNPDRYLGKQFRPQFLVLISIGITPVIYGGMVFALILINNSPLEPQILDNLALAAVISVGLSGTLVILANLPLVKNAIKTLIWSKRPPKNIDTPEKRMRYYQKHGGFPFGKIMVLNTMPQLSVIFGLLFAILLMVSFGMLESGNSIKIEGENVTQDDAVDDGAGYVVIENITLEESEDLVTGAVILGIFSSGCLLYTFGILRVQGDLDDSNMFGKVLISGSPGIVVQIIGLVIGLYYLVPFL
jgi:hypothetical protein